MTDVSSDAPPGVGIEPGNADLKSKGLVTTSHHEKLMEEYTNAVDDMLGTFPVGDEDEELGEYGDEQPPGLHVDESVDFDPPGLTTESTPTLMSKSGSIDSDTPTVMSKSGSMDSTISFGIPPGITDTKEEDDHHLVVDLQEDDNIVVMSVDPVYPPPATHSSESDTSKEYDDDDEVEPVPPEAFSVLEASRGTPADIVVRKKRDEQIPIEHTVHVQHSPSEPSPRLQRDHGVSAHTHHTENALRERLSRMQATQNDSDERINMLNQIHAREIETMMKRIEQIQLESKERESRLERKFEAAQAYSAKLMRHINENMSPREKADERYALEKQVIELKQHVDMLKDKLLSRAKERVFYNDDREEEKKIHESNAVVESVDPLYPPPRKDLERRVEELTQSLQEAQTRIGQQSLVIRGLQDHLRIFASKSNDASKSTPIRRIENNVTPIVRRNPDERRIVVRTTPSSSLDEIEKETASLAKFCTKMMRSRRKQNESSSLVRVETQITDKKTTNLPPIPSHTQQQRHHILPDSNTRRKVMDSVLDFNDDFGPRLSEDEVREIVSRSTMGFVNDEFQDVDEKSTTRKKQARRRLINKKSRRPSRKWHYTNVHW